MYIDLQCHTLASDGKLSPAQLMRHAHQLGFSYIAKTDHDTLDLMKEFLAAGRKYKIKAIPGIEISARYKNKPIHILGLGIDSGHPAIKDYCRQAVDARRQRALNMAHKLEKQGWHILRSELDRKLIVRPHVAHSVIRHPKNKKRLLKEFGQLPDFSTFITAYMVKGQRAFVKKTFALKASEAIKVIQQAAGLSIIAHPGSTSQEFCYTEKYLAQAIHLGFDGLEVYSSAHSKKQTAYLKNIAKKYKLLISGGSDYHGYDTMRPLGICHNGQYIQEKDCAPLLKLLS